jgi:hypothetical protein
LWAIAIFFGNISQNITTIVVITTMAMSGPLLEPKNRVNMMVATELAAMLTMLLPTKVIDSARCTLSDSHISPSLRFGWEFSITLNFTFPAAVIAVSVALKKNDKIKNNSSRLILPTRSELTPSSILLGTSHA